MSDKLTSDSYGCLAMYQMPGLTTLPGWLAPGQRKPFCPRWKGTTASLVAGISNLRPQSIHSTVYFFPSALGFSRLSIILFYCTLTGGVVAHNLFMVKMTEEIIGRKILVPKYPQLTGAIGAALYAMEKD